MNRKQWRRDMLQALKEDDAAILKELDVVRQHCCTASSLIFGRLCYISTLITDL